MRTQNIGEKTQIYFSRQYRRLKPDSKQRWRFFLGCVLPCLILFLFFYTEISYQLATRVKEILSTILPGNSLGIAYGEFLPFFGGVHYVTVPTTMPSLQQVLLNIVATVILLCLCYIAARKRKGRPLLIYFTMALLIHLVSCLFFAFAADYFPYSATEYSELYIKQQVSIWLSFLVLSSTITGVLGYGSIVARLTVFLGTMTYSFIFGTVRYVVYLLIITKGTSLYMATLFFSLGPLFDFLYLVGFYSIYINQQIKRFDHGEGRLEWEWL